MEEKISYQRTIDQYRVMTRRNAVVNPIPPRGSETLSTRNKIKKIPICFIIGFLKSNLTTHSSLYFLLYSSMHSLAIRTLSRMFLPVIKANSFYIMRKDFFEPVWDHFWDYFIWPNDKAYWPIIQNSFRSILLRNWRDKCGIQGSTKFPLIMELFHYFHQAIFYSFPTLLEECNCETV